VVIPLSSMRDPEPIDASLRKLRETLADRKRFRGMPASRSRELEDSVLAGTVTGRGLQFFVEWGLGAGSTFDAEDAAALDYLGETTALLSRNAMPHTARGVVRILLTDSHAAVNGVSVRDQQTYAASVRDAALARSFEPLLISDVIREHAGLTVDELLERSACFEPEWASLSSFTRQELTRRAAFRSKRDVPEIAARLYYCVSRLEGVILRSAFAGSIVVTYQTPNFAFLLPALPTIFMFVAKGRVTRRPWFKNDPGSRT
jgi:hypothetical protein